MESLSNYIQNNTEQVDEGLIKSAISLANLNSIDSKHLLEGILDMYDYICDDDDMDLFFQDMPTKEIVLWKNLYELYQKQVWSILDVDCSLSSLVNGANSSDHAAQYVIDSFNGEYGKLVKVTTDFRRNLRFLINKSRNSKLNIKPSAPDSMIAIQDSVKDKVFIITINRTTGLLNRLLRSVDKKYLTYAFSKLGTETVRAAQKLEHEANKE